MKKRDYLLLGIVIIVTIIFLIVVSGSKAPESIVGKGFLEGKVTIGPLCPVERFPPDPACQPTEKTYEAWPIAIWTESKIFKVAEISPNLDGTYIVELSPGTYIVDLENPQHFGARNLPATITIQSDKTTTLNIDIDTGIR